jgi:hypothetical protein
VTAIATDARLWATNPWLLSKGTVNAQWLDAGGASTYGGGSFPGPTPGGWTGGPGISVGPPPIAGPGVGQIAGPPPPQGYNPATSGPLPGLPSVAAPSSGSAGGVAGGATALSAHNMLKALALELAFVVVATMVAGINDTWASSMVALMLALLVLRGLFQVDLFGAFVSHTSLTPVGRTQ